MTFRQHLRRRAFSMLAIPLVVLLILTVLAISGSFSVINTRRALERARARQLTDIVATNAFEEAAERLSQEMGLFPLAKPGDSALPDRARLRWPKTEDPVVVRADVRADSIDLSPVSLSCTPTWDLLQDGDVLMQTLRAWGMDLDRHDHSIQEGGIIELAVKVQVALGPVIHARKVTVRRYVTLLPVEEGPGLPTRGRIHVMAVDLTHKVDEQ